MSARKKKKPIVQLAFSWEGAPILGEYSEEQGRDLTGIPVVDNDPEVERLQRQIIELYKLVWKVYPATEDRPQVVWFDWDREIELSAVLLGLIRELKDRLEEINDGSFEIDDAATDYMQNVFEEESQEGFGPLKPKPSYGQHKDAEPVYWHVRKSFKDIFGVWFLVKQDFDGDYDMPVLGSFSDISKIDYLALCSRRSEYHKTENTAVCFYQFDHVFDGKDGLYNAIIYQDKKALAEFEERLQGIKWFVSPDYSMFGDFPNALQIFNVYRSRLVDCWLRDELGAEVIPNVRFTLDFTYEYAFDGIPKGSNIALGMVGLLKEKENREMFDEGFPKLIDKLKPKAILVYGYVNEDSIEDLFGYALERGVKIVVPHSGLDRLKGPKAFIDTKQPHGEVPDPSGLA